jgi:Putative zinc-finger
MEGKSSMPVTDEKSGDWNPCAEGTLEQYALRNRNQKLVRRGVVSFSLVLLVMGGFALRQSSSWNPNDPSAKPYGGVSCAEVESRLEAFVANSLEELQKKEVLAHIRDCPLCAAKLKDLQQSKAGKHVRFRSHTFEAYNAYAAVR